MFDQLLIYAGWATIAALIASLVILTVRLFVELGKEDWHRVGINMALITIILLLSWIARVPRL